MIQTAKLPLLQVPELTRRVLVRKWHRGRPAVEGKDRGRARAQLHCRDDSIAR